MGKGLSERQTLILKVLGQSGSLGTQEIAARLLDCGHLSYSTPRRQLMFSMRRALNGLHERGYVEGVYRKGLGQDDDCMPSWGTYIEWTITDDGQEYLKGRFQ